MKDKFEQLLKRVVLTSVGSMTLASTSMKSEELIEEENILSFEAEEPSRRFESPRLLMKLTDAGEWEFSSHRSHRSHSSHRSHYSSTSSSRSRSSNSSSSRSTISLGSRSLVKDVEGTDVSEFVKLLIKLKLWEPPYSSYVVPKTMKFDDKVHRAVRQFQKSEGLTETGRADVYLIVLIQSKAKSVTSSSADSSTLDYGSLGNRTLTKGLKGTDVSELVKLLLKLKYWELPRTGYQIPASMEFDDNVDKAVKAFQRDEKLTDTGRVDAFLVLLLKNKVKEIDKK